ncbi:hypothetical protein [Prochlorococcus sp. MIT 0801]|uniref:hypothetical protein n=1 Tax=Prochlorococcus sp. MIT 0801 TaxID=1501269 RepID=UPI00056DAA84|nr:hypothetical protein [Prochlorococcus sp. MIT 0801]
MITSFIGILISSMAMTALILSIQSIEKSYRRAGKHSLTKYEIDIINTAGLNTDENINLLKKDIENLPKEY